MKNFYLSMLALLCVLVTHQSLNAQQTSTIVKYDGSSFSGWTRQTLVNYVATATVTDTIKEGDGNDSMLWTSLSSSNKHTSDGAFFKVHRDADVLTGGAYGAHWMEYQAMSPMHDFTNKKYPYLELEMQTRFETGNYDGCWLEVSTDGGKNWMTVPNSWLNINYDGTVALVGNGTTPYFPSKQPAWWAARTDWTTLKVNLSSLAGQDSVQFKFAQYHDPATSGYGWSIDNVIVGDFTPITSDQPYAYAFDGIDDFYETPNSKDFTNIDNALTLEAWVNPSNTNGAYTIAGEWSNFLPNGKNKYLMSIINNGVYFYGSPDGSGNSNYAYKANALQAGEWNHLAGTYDGDSLRLFINGEYVHGDTLSGGIYRNATDTASLFTIGSSEAFNNTLYKGYIDEVRVWNTALSESDIRNRMHKRIDNNDSKWNNLQAYYTFDEEEHNLLLDRSQNSNNSWLDNSLGDGWYDLTDTITVGVQDTVLVGTAGWYTASHAHALSRLYNADWKVSGGTILETREDSAYVNWNTTVGSGYIELTYTNSTQSTTVTSNRFRVERVLPSTPYALVFDGTDDYVVVESQPEFTTDLSNALTFETWIRPAGVSGNSSIGGVWNNGSVGKNAFLMGKQGTNVYFYVSPDGYTNSYSAGAINVLSPDKWTHIAGTFDGDSIRIYANGKWASSLALTKDMYNATDVGDFRIGKTDAYLGPIFDGYIDEVRVWNTALSEADIQARMHAVVTESDSKWNNLVMYYQMDFGSGETAYDYSRNGFNGTMNGQIPWEVLNVDSFTIEGADTLHIDSTSTYAYSLNGGDARLYNYQWEVTNVESSVVNPNTWENTLKFKEFRLKDTLDLTASHSNFRSKEENTYDFYVNHIQDVAITNVTSTNTNKGYGRDSIIYITVEYNEIVYVTGTPTLEMEVGPTDKYATYYSGTGTDKLVFKYIVTAGDSTTDFDYTSTTSLWKNGGDITDRFMNSVDTVLPTPGSPNSLGGNKDIIVDGDPAYIANVTSSTPNGHYKSGDYITVRIEFSENVVFSGRPLLELETGNTDTKVRFATGSGYSYTFIYRVGSTDSTLDLDYTSSTSLIPNGSSITDLNGLPIDWTLPTPGTSGSLGDNKDIVIDNTPPKVTNITSTNGNGTYTIGYEIDITVSFDEKVYITGTPLLELPSGNVSYTSGSGSSTITFKYTVKSGDDVTDLDYKAITSLLTGGGSITDKAGNDADLDLPTPGGSGSLGGNKDIVIDTKEPTVVSVKAIPTSGTKLPGDTVWIEVTHSEIVYVNTTSGTPTIELETGITDRVATYHSGSGSSTTRYYYVVQTGDENDDLDYKSTTSYSTNGGSITDFAGNNGNNKLPKPGDTGSIGSSSNVVVDGIPPMIVKVHSTNKNGTYGIGDTVFVNVEYDDDVYVSGKPSFTLETGNPDQEAKYFKGSGSSTIVYYYIVQKGDESPDLNYKSTTINLNGGSMEDKNGNDAEVDLPTSGNGTLKENSDIEVDGVPAQIIEVTSSTPNGSYTIGKTVTVKVKYDEDVWVSGTPRIELTTGGYATYVSGNGTDELIFEYTIVSGENTPDLNYKSTTSFTLNGGEITDKGGNDAELDLPSPTSKFSLGGGHDIVVDTDNPGITRVTAKPNTGTYKPGDKINIEISTDEITYVDLTSGTPCITVEVGAVDRQACYISGSGTGTLVFEYVVQKGDETTDLEYVPNSFSLNGSKVTDKAGNSIKKGLPSTSGPNSLGNTSSVGVDGVGPKLVSVSTTNPDGTYKIGDDIDIVLEYDEDVTISGTPCITVETGGVDRQACYVSGNGTDKIVFRYTVKEGDESPDLDYKSTKSLKLNGGSLTDKYGNDGELDLPELGNGSLGDNHDIHVDGVPPYIINVTSFPDRGSVGIGDTVTICTEFSDTVNVLGTPTIALETGDVDRNANYIGGSGTTTLCYSYIVQEGDSTIDLNYKQPGAVNNNGGTITDKSGNDAKVKLPADKSGRSLGDNSDTKVDGKKPFVNKVTSTNPDGTYSAGDTVFVEITTNEVVCVEGQPVLNLKNGKKAVYHSGSCSNKIVFRYIIEAEDSTVSLEYDYPNAIDTSNGNIVDKVGNDMDLDLPKPGGGKSLGDNTNIIINATPRMTVLVGSQICENDDVFTQAFTVRDIDDGTANLVFTATSSNGFVVPVSNIVFGGTGDNRTVTVTPATDVFGSSEITVVVTDNDKASVSSTFSLVVYAKPDADFNMANNCVNFKTPFENKSQINSGHIVNYAWTFGDTNGAGVKDPTHLYAAAGTYTVDLVAASNYGCLDTASAQITIYEKPTADYTIADVCFRNPSEYKNTSTLGHEYLWDFGDDWGISTLQNPTYLYSKPGTYDATLFITSINGCKDTVSKTTTVFALPRAGFSVLNHCFNEEFTPVNESSGNVSDYNWAFGDGNSDNVEAPIYAYNADGEYTINLEVTTADGCKDEVSHLVTVYPLPVITTSNDTMVSKGYEAHLVAKGGVAYLWSPIEQLNRPRQSTTDAIVLEDIKYVVTVASEFGCTDTASVNLRVREDYTLEPSNVITPDGNGKNDNWIVEKAQYYNDVEVMVFDRWGRIVYQSTAYDNTWDGTNKNGNALPDGAYYYVVKVPADRSEYKGSITIFR